VVEKPVRRREARRGQVQCWGEAGDGARKLLPWTANPGAQKHFDPEHLLAGDSKGSSLALVLYSLCCVVLSHYVFRTHPPTLRRHFCPRARHEMLYPAAGHNAFVLYFFV
jgi:hypothetical protein